MSSQFPFSHQLSSYGNGYVDHSAEKASEALYRLGGKEFLILYQSIPWLVRWKKNHLELGNKAKRYLWSLVSCQSIV